MVAMRDVDEFCYDCMVYEQTEEAFKFRFV